MLPLVQRHTQLLTQRGAKELCIGGDFELVAQERHHVGELMVGRDDDRSEQRLFSTFGKVDQDLPRDQLLGRMLQATMLGMVTREYGRRLVEISGDARYNFLLQHGV